MNICRISVTRPIAIIVFMILIVLFGLLSLTKIPVREFPNIEIPTISIKTVYLGASAQIVETKITQVIENAMSGIQNLESIQSSSKNGQSTIKLQFSINRNIDYAANDVRDAIGKISNKLPENADMPIISKFDSDSNPILIISLHDTTKNRMELTDYANRYIVDKFSVIDGVADVGIIGGQIISMRIWLDRKAMAAKNVTVSDIENALKLENVEYPGGRIESVSKEFFVLIQKQYQTPEDFKKIVVLRKKNNDIDSIVRLEDIARVVIEPKNQRNVFMANGKSGICLAIFKQNTANTLSIARDVKNIVKQISNNLPKHTCIQILSDESSFIYESIKEVCWALLIAFCLVFLIIFIFLGSLRAAIIPMLAVPVSLIGSFTVLYLLNYSINILTLLAMVLGIGIIVDDAILVLENIYRYVEKGVNPLVASVNGAKQIIFAVISTTVVLLAVFLPIMLWPGKTGKLFTEFAIAMSTSIIFSSIVSLTLTPMLCSKILNTYNKNRFLIQYMDRLIKKSFCLYEKVLTYCINNVKIIICMFAAILCIVIILIKVIPQEYEPKEDRNALNIKITSQEGIGLYAMANYIDKVNDTVMPLLDNGIANNILSVIPGFGANDGAVNSALIMLDLVDCKDRKLSSKQIANKYKKSLNKIVGIKAVPILPNGIGVKGNQAIQFVIGGYDYSELEKWRKILFDEIDKYPGMIDVDSDYKETSPQFSVLIDKDRTNTLNIAAAEIGNTISTMLGSKKVTTFINKGYEYDVILQAEKTDRNNIDDMCYTYVRSANADGTLIPLDNLIKVQEKGSASKLGRFNRTRSITISGNIANGYSIDSVLKFLETKVKEKLPEYAQIFYTGQSKDFKESSNGVVFVFILAILIAFFVLSAQFESFNSPFVIMLTVPLGVFGASLALFTFGISFNIYSQIGLVMLIGLSCKHGILIVEFANQLRDQNMEFKEALITAAKLRLRPIIMTGLSTIIGAIPLMCASGSSALSRQSLGVVQVFGGISGMLLTLIFIPVGYFLLSKNTTTPHEIELLLQKYEEKRDNVL